MFSDNDNVATSSDVHVNISSLFRYVLVSTYERVCQGLQKVTFGEPRL